MRLLRRLLIFACAYVLLCVALTLASPLVSPDCAAVETPRDIAVVLGSGNTAKKLNPSSRARIAGGVALYKAGRVKALHTTGAGLAGNASVGEGMARMAIREGVPADRVTWEGRARSTLENALLSLPVLPQDAELIIVTDRFHSLRGAASFVWAGRPSAFCSVPLPRDGTNSLWRTPVWEVGGWGVNIARGAVFLAASAVGLADHLPDAFLQ